MTRPWSSGRHSGTPWRTAATSECVVPRSMPTAMRRWCGSGAWPGSDIWSNAMTCFLFGCVGLRERIDALVDVAHELVDEHQAAHGAGDAAPVDRGGAI